MVTSISVWSDMEWPYGKIDKIVASHPPTIKESTSLDGSFWEANSCNFFNSSLFSVLCKLSSLCNLWILAWSSRTSFTCACVFTVLAWLANLKLDGYMQGFGSWPRYRFVQTTESEYWICRDVYKLRSPVPDVDLDRITGYRFWAKTEEYLSYLSCLFHNLSLYSQYRFSQNSRLYFDWAKCLEQGKQ